MRIVFAHNRYLHRGGEDESREQEMLALKNRGHQIFEYVTDNRDVAKSSYLSTGARSVWNRREKLRVDAFLRKTEADVLKVDNYFPLLSTSIFEAAQSLGVATVLSVRNYRVICPASTLYRDGAPCTKCVGKKFALPAVRHRCYRGSALQSLAVALGNAYGHVGGIWSRVIDNFIAVSEHVRNELVRGGFPSERISVKPNFIRDTGVGDGSGGYALYVGRLTPEKGISTLLDAWEQIGTVLPLKIVGDGPLQADIQARIKTFPGIEYLGRKPLEEVCELLGRATALIFPSEWSEPFGRAVIEAFSKGTPVIAADTPVVRTLVSHSSNGWLYRVGSSGALVEAVRRMMSDPMRLVEMRACARETYLQNYTPELNYLQMMEIFHRAISRKKGQQRQELVVPSAP